MGGLSTGTLDFSEGKLKFSGDINLNGGGFSSVRRSYSPGKHDSNEGFEVWIPGVNKSSS